MNKLANKYQYNYSVMHREEMYNRQDRERKAKTMLAVLQDYFNTDLQPLALLDFGSSTGFIAHYLAMYFGQVVGIDIDGPALAYARATHKKDNLHFIQADSIKIEMPDNHFDVIICAQVYEHVPDAVEMMDQIYRVLKTDGVCYFAATNRLKIIEPHHRLPFLSYLPRQLAHRYVRWSGRGSFYYEKLRFYWGLTRLVRKFEVIDYTRSIVENPHRFSADYMLKKGTIKASLAAWIVKYAFWLCPGYIWLLRKK